MSNKKQPPPMFGYIGGYEPNPSKSVTGLRRVYDACRAGVESREDLQYIKDFNFPTKQNKRNFLEDANWAHFNYPDCMLLLLDIIPHYDPDFQTSAMFWKPRFDAIKNYSRVLVPSQWVKKTLVEDMGVKDDRIEVQLLGVNREVFKPMAMDRAAWCAKWGIPNRVFMIGHASYGYTRKNMDRVMRALAPVGGPILIKVGKDPLTEMFAAQQGMEDRVFYLPKLTDEELAEFYNVIDLFAFPSTFEGFGLPALEAQACGCPVLTSDTTALAEIIGPYAVGVDPFSVGKLREAFTARWERAPAGCPDLSAWLAQFNWENTGKAVNNWLS